MGDQNEPRHFIISGGPGSGKRTAVGLIAQAFVVLEGDKYSPQVLENYKNYGMGVPARYKRIPTLRELSLCIMWAGLKTWNS